MERNRRIMQERLEDLSDGPDEWDQTVVKWDER